MDNDNIVVLAEAVKALASNDKDAAEKIISEKYPFKPVKKDGRNYRAPLKTS